MEKLHKLLKIAIWCVIGVFIGTSIYQYYDYYTHPGLYALTSAPWYLGIQIAGIFTVIIVSILLLVIWFIKKKNK